jgi:thiol-disulfide isomerase/thioredoxin
LTVWQYPVASIFTISTFYAILFSVLVPITLWYLLKPIFIKSKDHDLYFAAYKRLQYNPEIFNSLLKQQTPILDGWQDIGIDVGNLIAKNTIVKICNPYCKPCEKSHEQLMDIINNNSNVRLKIIYISYNNLFDKGAEVVKKLLSIAEKGNMHQTQMALNDWYLNVGKNFNFFLDKYPDNGNSEQQGEKLNEMGRWCDDAGVTHTPTIFVNGFRLPENYKTEELKYIL